MSVVPWEVCNLLSIFLTRGRWGKVYSLWWFQLYKNASVAIALGSRKADMKFCSLSSILQQKYPHDCTHPDEGFTLGMIWLRLLRQSANTLEVLLTNWVRILTTCSSVHSKIFWASLLDIVERIPPSLARYKSVVALSETKATVYPCKMPVKWRPCRIALSSKMLMCRNFSCVIHTPLVDSCTSDANSYRGICVKVQGYP